MFFENYFSPMFVPFREKRIYLYNIVSNTIASNLTKVNFQTKKKNPIKKEQ